MQARPSAKLLMPCRFLLRTCVTICEERVCPPSCNTRLIRWCAARGSACNAGRTRNSPSILHLDMPFAWHVETRTGKTDTYDFPRKDGIEMRLGVTVAKSMKL